MKHNHEFPSWKFHAAFRLLAFGSTAFLCNGAADFDCHQYTTGKSRSAVTLGGASIYVKSLFGFVQYVPYRAYSVASGPSDVEGMVMP